jgi:phosphomannomutase
LLAEAFLKKTPGAKIVHDPRLTWNTIDVANQGGGEAIQSKTGHAFIKERMRTEDAVYGGEMSAHHYFKDFFYCDSGMIPWLLVLELVCKTGRPLSDLVEKMVTSYPSPGEINCKVSDANAVIQEVKNKYESEALVVDITDGVSMEFTNWRFNLRMSNTEPVIRLNIESRGDRDILAKRKNDLLKLIESV